MNTTITDKHNKLRNLTYKMPQEALPNERKNWIKHCFRQ